MSDELDECTVVLCEDPETGLTEVRPGPNCPSAMIKKYKKKIKEKGLMFRNV